MSKLKRNTKDVVEEVVVSEHEHHHEEEHHHHEEHAMETIPSPVVEIVEAPATVDLVEEVVITPVETVSEPAPEQSSSSVTPEEQALLDSLRPGFIPTSEHVTYFQEKSHQEKTRHPALSEEYAQTAVNYSKIIEIHKRLGIN